MMLLNNKINSNKTPNDGYNEIHQNSLAFSFDDRNPLKYQSISTVFKSVFETDLD